MPFLAYVRSGPPDPPPEEARPLWEPNLRIWRWVLMALPPLYAALRTDGAAELVAVFLVLALVCRAALEAVPDGDGLRHFRQ